MTVCNMSIEAGAKAGLIAPDEVTFEYLKGRPHAPQGDEWDRAVADWRTLVTDEGATFDKEVFLDAADIEPFVSWGTNPGQVIPLSASIPSPDDFDDQVLRDAATRALEYMDLRAGTNGPGANRHILPGDAHDEVGWAVVAQQFLDSLGDERGVGEQLRARPGVPS